MGKPQIDALLDAAIKRAPADALVDHPERAERWPKGETPALFADLHCVPGLAEKRSISRRTFEPVRRKSYRRGREGAYWRPTRRADLRIMYRAAERLELNARIAGKKNGPIGHIGLEVMRELMRIVDYSTGRLEPCIDTIAANIRRARSAVIKALARLRDAGFLDWMRRFEPTGETGRRGPQVRQVSNAYRFVMPAFIGRLLGFHGQGVPLPEDFEDRQRDQRRERDRWEFEETPVFRALEKLRVAVERSEHERESAKGSESPSHL